MRSAFVIGGTRFIGRHTVTELLSHGYEVTMLTRGNRENPFGDRPSVDHVLGDRTDRDTLETAARRSEPDAVVDCIAYHPADVRTATEVFHDVEAYVYVSSGAAYVPRRLPKREDETPLRECTPAQATDDTMASYGPRKAEGDRAVFEAADHGVNAMSVRPTLVYGPHDYQEYLAYWIDRVHRFDRVAIPGDGTGIWHRVYVEDVASGIRTVAEAGEPGEAYNAGDRRVLTLADTVEAIVDALDTDTEIVQVGRTDLDRVGIEPADFPLNHHPATGYPHILETCKFAALGWDSTPAEVAMARTVEDSLASGRNGRDLGPARETVEELLSGE